MTFLIKLLNLTAYVFIVTVVIGFISNIYFERGLLENQIEKPFIDVKGLVVDDKGKIYVGLGFYGIVQVYDSNGIFIQNWSVENRGGSFKMGVSDKQNIIITTTRGDQEIIYNGDGEFIESKHQLGIYSEVESFKGKFVSSFGDIYTIDNRIFPSILNVYPKTKTIVAQSIAVSLFKRTPLLIAIIVLSIIWIIIGRIAKTNLSNKK